MPDLTQVFRYAYLLLVTSGVQPAFRQPLQAFDGTDTGIHEAVIPRQCGAWGTSGPGAV